MNKYLACKLVLLFILSSIVPSIADTNLIKSNELKNETEYKKIILTGSEYFLISSPIEIVFTTSRIKEFYKKNKNKINSDLYSISLRDNKDKELFKVNIGNPFLLHAQHMGYEGQRSTGPNNNAKIEIYFPSSIEPSSIKIMKNSMAKSLNIQDIKLYK